MKYMLLLVPIITGCHLAKPACQVVDLMDDVCRTFVYLDENGNKQSLQLTNTEAREFLMTGKRFKSSGKCDSGH